MNKDCQLNLIQCGDHCKYFRVMEKKPEALRIVGCVFKACHEYIQPEDKGPEECFEGTPNADECIRLERGQYWDGCPYGGGWKR